MSRADGVTQRELNALADHAAGSMFSGRDRVALTFAEVLTTSNTVGDALFERVRREFTEDEIVELTATITWEICAAKFNRALEIEGQGICAVQKPSGKKTRTPGNQTV